ncbi:MAG: NAD(P)/FAD-dependent oxidoreductase [Chloroflexi bacterium]|nr:MAG: NAD(P)/FAD-dependent oxidoreductase [Chloroflexota bacterium]
MPDPSSPGSTKHVVVIGAGPAGLSAAYELTRHRTPVTVVEKDPLTVGGIARTLEFMGCRFDVGPHRFFSKSAEIEALWTEILGDRIQPVRRLTRIQYRGKFFDYPIRASNAFWNLGPFETARCLASYAQARLHPVVEPKSFEDWVSNQFGHRLFEIFFKTYTEKVWGISTRELSADWAGQRIRGLNLVEVIRNALLPAGLRGGGEQAIVKTLVDSFRYPRLGAGQMWETVAARLAADGHPVRLGEEVVGVRHAGGRVLSVVLRDGRGSTLDLLGSEFISTMPIRELIAKLQPAAPSIVRAAAEALGYRDFITVNLVVDRAEVFPDQWIYVHDPGVKVGRIANFKNFSSAMVADGGLSGLGMEYFCFEHDGMWSWPDRDLLDLGRRELVALGICRADEVKAGMVYRQPKAYPVYDGEYQHHLEVIREWLTRALPNLWLVGRNGMHHYNNQDHSMMTGILVARNIATGTSYDPWLVNTDAEYQEEERAGEGSSVEGGRQVPQRIAS